MFKSNLKTIKIIENNYYVCYRTIQTQRKQKEHQQQELSTVKPIISCKRNEYNFYGGNTKPKTSANNKLHAIKLASKGWHNKLSRGDYFIIHTQPQPTGRGGIIENQQTEKTFAELGISNDGFIENLKSNGITCPSEIQKQAIPILLQRKNTIIAAETGCGKTLAYLLPILEQIIHLKKKGRETKLNTPFCLILTPGRELAYQIETVAKSLSDSADIKTDVIVGGGTKRKMLNPTFKETDLLVATLGALSKLTTTGIYRMADVRHVVLDEADTLLDESFAEKLAHFLKKIPFQYHARETSSSGAQLTLCSATLVSSLPDVLADIIVPESLETVTTDRVHKLLHVPQRFLRLTKSMRPAHLLQLVKRDVQKKWPIIVFSNTSQTCDWISLFLNENGVKCANLNGDMSLYLRRNKFNEFQNGHVDVLSCTDVGSRGLDTIKVKHVINFDFPKYTSDYIHRCGRIGRLGSPDNSHVTNFVCSYPEIELTQQIEMAVRTQESLPKVNGNIAGIIKNNILRQMREM